MLLVAAPFEMLAQTVMFLVSVWCLWQFFAATEVLAAVKWGLSGATRRPRRL